MVSYHLLVLIISIFIGRHRSVTGQSCQQVGLCVCKFNNGSEIDLTPLGLQNGSALINQLTFQDYRYSFNPCFPFTEGVCQAVAGCQLCNTGTEYYIIGDVNSAQLTYDGKMLVGRYSHVGSITRESVVDYICDSDAETPVVSTEGEISPLTYKFSIKSKHACPTAAPTPTPTPSPTTPKPRCYTDYEDFTKRCNYGYDGHAEPVKLLIINDWNGVCLFPTNLDVAMHLYSEKATCHGVSKRCHPDQPFSVNNEVCKEP